MLLADAAVLERWMPDFSPSGQASPLWTRAVCEGFELCNALEWVAWRDAPAQLLLCEACGAAGCQPGGYGRVARLEEQLLWTPPFFDAAEQRESPQYRPSPVFRRYGSVLLSAATWTRWRTVVPELPPADDLPAATRMDLMVAWLGENRGPAHVEIPEKLAASVEKHLTRSAPLEPPEAVSGVAALVAWTLEARGAAVHGAIRRAEPSDTMVTLTLGPVPWTAFATGPRFAFGRELVFELRELR
jgi:hypothetical protein